MGGINLNERLPARGGTRGGAAHFTWDTVKEDKHRENYLGNSVAAPRGRWAEGRDILWYSKGTQDSSQSDDRAKRRAELAELKRAEKETMEQMLASTLRSQGGAGAGAEGGTITGANAAPLGPGARTFGASKPAETPMRRADAPRPRRERDPRQRAWSPPPLQDDHRDGRHRSPRHAAREASPERYRERRSYESKNRERSSQEHRHHREHATERYEHRGRDDERRHHRHERDHERRHRRSDHRHERDPYRARRDDAPPPIEMR